MSPEAVENEADNEEDRAIQHVFRQRLAAGKEVQIDTYRVDCGNDRYSCNSVGDRIAAALRVHHRVKNQADNRKDQEHVLRQQHNGLVLHQQPEDREKRQAQQVNRPFNIDWSEEALRQLLRFRRICVTHQVFLAVHERAQTDDHANAGGAEAVPPAERFAEPAT